MTGAELEMWIADHQHEVGEEPCFGLSSVRPHPAGSRADDCPECPQPCDGGRLMLEPKQVTTLKDAVSRRVEEHFSRRRTTHVGDHSEEIAEIAVVEMIAALRQAAPVANPCAGGRCPDPEAHAEGAHDL